VGFREFDLMPDQQRLQIFLDGLLAMEGDDLPQAAAAWKKVLIRVKIGAGFVQPQLNQFPQATSGGFIVRFRGDWRAGRLPPDRARL
jgi:hypothetical protein